MAKSTITVNIKLAWWLEYLYLPGVRMMHNFIINYVDVEATANADKVRAVIKRGVKFYIKGKRVC